MTANGDAPAGSRVRHPRSWSASTRVASVMMGVALLSVLATGIYNFFSARDLLTGTVEQHLIDVTAARALEIEAGMDHVQDITSTIAADDGVAQALAELAGEFVALDQVLTPAQTDELFALYAEGILQRTPPGVEPPTTEELFPASERARYLQYHYIARNSAEDRSDLVAADDGSAYSAAHARHHPVLRALARTGRLGDLLLIDAATSSIVYTTDKRIDFGTNLAVGPHRDSGLAEAVLEQLRTAAAGEAVVVDFAPYAPAGGNPTLFVAAAIRDGGQVIGAVALEVPNELLVDITTAGGDWEGTGLGETGEVYIVGEDGLMRSTSRLWLEDPAAYLEAVADAGYPPDLAEAVETFDTTVLIQPVDTEGANSARRGDSFSGVSSNYLAEDTLTVAGGLDVTGVVWVAVGEVSVDEAYAPLRSYIRRLVLIAVILVPLVALAGIYLARRLMRPVAPIAAATGRVSEGDLEVELPAHGRDEFAELGRRFDGMVEALREQRAELARTDAETTELLAAVLPERLVERVKSGERDVAEAVRNATLIAINVGFDRQATAADPDELLSMEVELQRQLRELAESFGVEQLHSSSSQQLLAAGLRTDGTEAGRALDFMTSAQEAVGRFGDTTGAEPEFRAGLAAGDVVAGVVGTERIAFDVWGHPSRLAVALAAVARPGEVLVDAAVAAAVGDEWQLERDPGLLDLGGESLAGWYVRGRPGTSDSEHTELVP